MTHIGQMTALAGCLALSWVAASPGQEALGTASFPATWIGSWKGVCRAVRPDGSVNKFAMELHIRPTDNPDRMTWQIVYGAGRGRQVRDYELMTQDRGQGKYAIDEKNSIVIDSYLIGSALWSQYSVNDQLITVRYDKDGDAIRFLLMSSKLGAPRVSGGPDTPKVSTYPVVVAQQALLTPLRD